MKGSTTLANNNVRSHETNPGCLHKHKACQIEKTQRICEMVNTRLRKVNQSQQSSIDIRQYTLYWSE